MDTGKGLATLVAAAIVVIVAVQPLYVVALTIFDYGSTPEATYATMQTKDASRFPADDPAQLSAYTAQAARPPGSNLSYETVARVPRDNWQTALAASRLRAASDAIVLYGSAPRPAADTDGVSRNATTMGLSGGNPAQTAARIATNTAGSDEVSPDNVLIVSSANPRWALPAAAWSAYSGDPILYADEDGVPSATREAIDELGAEHAYVLAPDGLIGDEALSNLGVEWTRIAGSTPQDHAVEFAKYRDESRDFGWGIDDREKVGYYNFMLVNPERTSHAVASANLQWGRAGPLLLADEDGSLPAVTENYLWRSQPSWFSTPAEGPFNHLYALGSLEQVSWITQTRGDYAVEITPYRLQGAGMSPLDALSAVWAAFSLLGASFVYAHSRRRIPEMKGWTKMVWPMFTLLLGPFGLAFYWLAYRGRRVVERDGKKQVVRPYWLRAATATAMGVAFAAGAMIATAFLLTYFGMPLVVFDGPLFMLGSSMVLTMAIVYVVAFFISWSVFHIPMFQDSLDLDARPAARRGLLAVAVSMTSVSVGMMSMMWVLMMLNLPMMPGDDNILWFGVMVFSTLVGFLIAWPVNGILVRRNVKPGGAL